MDFPTLVRRVFPLFSPFKLSFSYILHCLRTFIICNYHLLLYLSQFVSQFFIIVFLIYFTNLLFYVNGFTLIGSINIFPPFRYYLYLKLVHSSLILTHGFNSFPIPLYKHMCLDSSYIIYLTRYSFIFSVVSS